jgi:hypothetical protein
MSAFYKNIWIGLWILIFCTGMVHTISAQSKDQKKVLKDIKSTDEYFYVEVSHSNAAIATKLAQEKLFGLAKKNTQFTAKTQAIQRGLLLPNSVQLGVIQSEQFSSLKLKWKKKRKQYVFLYLKKEEAINQLATNYRIVKDTSEQLWYLGQAIHTDQASSSQLAASNLADNFGVVTSSVQTFAQSENTENYYERYSQEITQQRTVLLSGQKQIQINWSPNKIASYMLINEQKISVIDQELATVITTNFFKAEAHSAIEEIDEAWYAYYVGYLTSLLRFKPMLINGENAQDLLSSKIRSLVENELIIKSGRAYLLNQQTVAIPISLIHKNGISGSYDLAYKDYTGTTITKLEGGKGLIYLKNPSSTSQELVIPIKLSASLNSIDKNDSRFSMLDKMQKGWVNSLFRIDLSSVQKVDISMRYRSDIQQYQFIAEPSFIDAQQVEWMIGNEHYIASPLNLSVYEMPDWSVSLRVNGNKNLVSSIKIDSTTQTAKKIRNNLEIFSKFKEISLPKFYDFLNEINSSTILLNELNRLKNIEKITYGNIQRIPKNDEFILISFDRNQVLYRWFLIGDSIFNISNGKLDLSNKQISDIIESNDQLLWIKEVQGS